MSIIKIEKDIFVKDEFGVRWNPWMAGDEVESYLYHAILRTNTVVNPEDLPKEETPANKGLETKELAEDTPTLKEEEVPETKKSKKKGKDK